MFLHIFHFCILQLLHILSPRFSQTVSGLASLQSLYLSAHLQRYQNCFLPFSTPTEKLLFVLCVCLIHSKLSLCINLSIFFYVSMCLYLSINIRIYVHICIYLSVWICIYLFIHHSIYPSIYVFIFFIYLSVDLSISHRLGSSQPTW